MDYTAIIIGAIIGGIIALIIHEMKYGDKLRHVGGGEFEVTQRTGCIKSIVTTILFGIIGAAIVLE